MGSNPTGATKQHIFKDDMNTESETVTITKEAYDYLVEQDKILNALQRGGVRNWEWYDASLEDHYEDDE